MIFDVKFFFAFNNVVFLTLCWQDRNQSSPAVSTPRSVKWTGFLVQYWFSHCMPREEVFGDGLSTHAGASGWSVVRSNSNQFQRLKKAW